jgi:hypothetical protein
VRIGRIFMALFVVLGVLVAGATALVVVKPELFFEMEGEALALSVADEVGDAANRRVSGEDCKRRRGDLWRCTVDEDPGSGAQRDYDVRAIDDDCWRLAQPSQAEIRRRFDTGPRTVRACLSLLDYLGFG